MKGKNIVLTLSFLAILIVVFSKKEIQIVVYYANEDTPSQVELDINGESIFDGTLAYGSTIPYRFEFNTYNWKNSLKVNYDIINEEKEFNLFSILDSHVIIVFFGKEEEDYISVRQGVGDYYSW